MAMAAAITPAPSRTDTHSFTNGSASREAYRRIAPLPITNPLLAPGHCAAIELADRGRHRCHVQLAGPLLHRPLLTADGTAVQIGIVIEHAGRQVEDGWTLTRRASREHRRLQV